MKSLYIRLKRLSKEEIETMTKPTKSVAVHDIPTRSEQSKNFTPQTLNSLLEVNPSPQVSSMSKPSNSVLVHNMSTRPKQSKHSRQQTPDHSISIPSPQIKSMYIRLKRLSKEEIEAMTKPSKSVAVRGTSTRSKQSKNGTQQTLNSLWESNPSPLVKSMSKPSKSVAVRGSSTRSKQSKNGTQQTLNSLWESNPSPQVNSMSKPTKTVPELNMTTSCTQVTLRRTNDSSKKRKNNDQLTDDENDNKKRKLNDGSSDAMPREDVIAQMDFKIGEIVWAKIKGHPHWPCVIKAFNKKMVIVLWYNDYRQTKIYKTQLFKFLKNFDQFSKLFDQRVGLETAAKEALIAYGHQMGTNMMF